MAYANAELIIAVIATLLSLIGVVGGIPQIIEWLRAKPHLIVNKVDFIKRKEKISDTNYAYDIFLEVENNSKWWRKAVDAPSFMVNATVWEKIWFNLAHFKIKWLHHFYRLVPRLGKILT